MAKTATELRAQAEKARLLLRSVSDPVTIRELTALANENEELAAALEARDKDEG